MVHTSWCLIIVNDVLVKITIIMGNIIRTVKFACQVRWHVQDDAGQGRTQQINSRVS